MSFGPALLIGTLLAAATVSADENRYANIRSVAVVSTLGDSLTMKNNVEFGGADPNVVLHTGADIDSYVTKQIREMLRGRFVIVSQTESPDALIIVHPSQIEQHVFLPPIAMTFRYNGLSATRTKGLFGRHTIILSAQYTVSVVDPKTGAELANGAAKAPATGIFGARPDPIEQCEGAFWPADLTAPSPSEAEQIRADVMAIVAASLPNALANARLSPLGNDIKPTDWNGHALACREFG